ncbi:hypothetical protein AT727_14855 [Desulfitobacterium hafniense]|uniref:Uncharacterized protein n=2 Tax=Desulfitobacterium hafniense TaxID=49338 RepID=A0A0W1JQ20_DESHA|nr:hypothetical protein AT727_14855 [Desulfitobacterium hafniense]
MRLVLVINSIIREGVLQTGLGEKVSARGLSRKAILQDFDLHRSLHKLRGQNYRSSPPLRKVHLRR